VHCHTVAEWSNKWFRLCDQTIGNSVFFRDLIHIEVSELKGIVRFIVRSVCKQFCLRKCAFNISISC
jgi:hypothetical protein